MSFAALIASSDVKVPSSAAPMPCQGTTPRPENIQSFSINSCIYDGGSFPAVTPAAFVPLYSRHRHDYARYKATPLYAWADAQLRAMVSRVKGRTRKFISSDIEIAGVLNVLGNSFAAQYIAFGFSVKSWEMLGMRLFELCVFDTGCNWWYPVPKPILHGHLFHHSHYHL
jgi:hypothetical protein